MILNWRRRKWQMKKFPISSNFKWLVFIVRENVNVCWVCYFKTASFHFQHNSRVYVTQWSKKKGWISAYWVREKLKCMHILAPRTTPSFTQSTSSSHFFFFFFFLKTEKLFKEVEAIQFSPRSDKFHSTFLRLFDEWNCYSIVESSGWSVIWQHYMKHENFFAPFHHGRYVFHLNWAQLCADSGIFSKNQVNLFASHPLLRTAHIQRMRVCRVLWPETPRWDWEKSKIQPFLVSFHFHLRQCIKLSD